MVRLPAVLARLPRWALLVPIAAIALVIVAGLALTAGDGGGGDKSAQGPISSSNLDIPATATPSPPPEPNRQDCNQIRGTDYLSAAERDWFLTNCPAASRPPVPSAPVGEFTIGDRLVIPAVGVNAVVTGMKVPTSGAMPDPSGYFNAVWYDFSSFTGLGGYTEGNMVLAGHVDCARCHNGGSGRAVFYSVRNLQAGATIQYVTSAGQTVNYVVMSSASYSPNSNWAPIVASRAADLTLITCTGTFSGGEYSLRHVVQAKRQ
jgi:Sortase domain